MHPSPSADTSSDPSLRSSMPPRLRLRHVADGFSPAPGSRPGSQVPSPVVHLELPTGNLARACDAYVRLCGWGTRRVDAGPRGYQALDWGGEIGGGVVECGTPRALWLPYVEVHCVAE